MEHPKSLSAVSTTGFYLREAIRLIDEEFGEGYAKAHPELVGAFMQTCTMQDVYSVLGEIGAGWGGAFDDVVVKLGHIAENVRSDHPLMGETLGGVSSALGDIASALGQMDEVADAIDPEGKRYQLKAKMYAMDEANKANGGKDG